MTALTDTLERLAEIPTDDWDAIKALQESWRALVAGKRATSDDFFDEYFRRIDAALAGEPGADLAAYRFLTAFTTELFFRPGASHSPAFERMRAEHPAHLRRIEAALAREDVVVTDAPLVTATGRWGDVVQAMLETYDQHLGAMQRRELVTDLLPSLRRFVRSFPGQPARRALGDLVELGTAEAEVPALVQYAAEHGLAGSAIMEELGRLLFGSSPFARDLQKSAGKLLAVAFEGAASPDQRRALVEQFLLRALGADPVSRDTVIGDLRRREALVRRRLERAPEKANPAWLVPIEKELALVESDFAAWTAARMAAATKALAASTANRRTVKAVLGKLRGPEAAALRALYDAATSAGTAPKRFPMPPASDNRFADLGLKLLVIEELMYVQGVLLPKLDVHELAKEWDKRPISVESDGYAVIPEVKRYFENLAIPDELLARVTKLHQSSGLDGGPTFLNHMFPFWDPGAGDEPIKVGAKAAEDLALLPNLRRISGLENSKPGPKLRAVLASRGVELVAEDAD